jgi:axial budding pattern protein 2
MSIKVARSDVRTTISGTVPDRYQNGTTNPVSIPITIASTNASNTLTLTAYYDLNILQYPFSAYSLPDIKAAPGDKVNVELGTYLNNATDITVSTVSSTQRKRAANDWLSYDSSSRSLSGTVPKDANGDLTVTLTAASGGYTGTSDMRINVASGNTNTSAAPSSSASSGSGNSPGGLSKGAKIGLGVGLGLLGLILLLLLLFCCRRRQKEQVDNDGDSFVAGPRSPMNNNDPFRKSAQQHRSIFGTMGLPWGKPDAFQSSPQPSMDTSTTVVEKPQRVDGLNGIFAMEKPTKNQSTPRLTNPSTASFLGQGDVIAISTPERTPREGDMSSFTDSFSSGSRASWESEHSFKWSSGENESRQQHGENSDARLSLAPSIARPRENFTPRYPRSNSPSRLQHLASGRTLDSPDFSEFGSPQSRRRSVRSPGFTASGSMGTGSNGSHSNSGSAPSGATFPSGPTGLDRWSRGDSSGTGMVLAEYDEDEHTDHEEPAVVKLAERQSFETRRPSTKRSTGPRLKPSRERMTSNAVAAGQPRHSRQLEQEQAQDEGMFDDAEDDHRRSRLTEASRLTTYAPDPNEDASHGLGYPASAIYFAEGNRDSSIRAIDAEAHNHPMSPPLPSVGSFVRPRPLSTASADQVDEPSRVSRNSTEVGSPKVPDGRVNAIANETFSIHPQIHPPPTVSLSAATWTSAPPSTYRAELVGGAQLPSWLHFDSRNLELWGVPAMEHSGDVLVLRIVEKMPRDKRYSNPMAFGYQPAPEREVGRMTIE